MNPSGSVPSDASTANGVTKIFICKHVPYLSQTGKKLPWPHEQETGFLWEKDGYNLHLQYIPKPQGRVRVTQNGTYNPNKKDKDAMSWQLKAQRHFDVLEGPLFVSILFCYPVPQRQKYAAPCTRPDLDNYVKILLDSANGILWRDDSQIVELRVAKRYL